MAELESKTIHSVAKAIHLLDLLAASGQPASLTELYQKTGWPKSTVDKLAKIMNRKNSAPQKRPPAMLTNTFGSVWKINAGPLSVSMPKEKQAGKMMTPAIRATNVSSAQMRTASPGRECESDI